jgi:DNA-binding GntR family transcriptional regulator
MWLRRFTDVLADHSLRYQAASIAAGRERRHPHAEHRALLDAALAGDVDGAVSLLEAHLDRTRRVTSGE